MIIYPIDYLKHRCRILMVTHVIPYPPSAGNEIRIFKLLSWLKEQGYFTTLILKPLGDQEIPNNCLIELKKLVADLHIYDNRSLPGDDNGNNSFLDTDLNDSYLCSLQENFCPKWFVAEVDRIIKHIQPNVIVAQYIFMSRILRLDASLGSLKIIDAHDLFCCKQTVVEQYCIKNYSLSLSEEQERSLLDRANVILAIQKAEQCEFKKLAPTKKVLLTTFDLDIYENNFEGIPGSVLIVASANEFNVRGTQDFIDYTWPLVREMHPDACLRVVGKVCEMVQTDDPSITLVGFTALLDREYQQAQVVVNPCRVGTGLKIKTIEALAWGKAHVAWPSAADGLYELGKIPMVIVKNIV